MASVINETTFNNVLRNTLKSANTLGENLQGLLEHAAEQYLSTGNENRFVQLFEALVTPTGRANAHHRAMAQYLKAHSNLEVEVTEHDNGTNEHGTALVALECHVVKRGKKKAPVKVEFASRWDQWSKAESNKVPAAMTVEKIVKAASRNIAKVAGEETLSQQTAAQVVALLMSEHNLNVDNLRDVLMSAPQLGNDE